MHWKKLPLINHAQKSDIPVAAALEYVERCNFLSPESLNKSQHSRVPNITFSFSVFKASVSSGIFCTDKSRFKKKFDLQIQLDKYITHFYCLPFLDLIHKSFLHQKLFDLRKKKFLKSRFACIVHSSLMLTIAFFSFKMPPTIYFFCLVTKCRALEPSLIPCKKPWRTKSVVERFFQFCK